MVIKHVASNTRTCLGYLPGDINGNGISNPSDNLDFIDHLNGVKSLPIYSVDMDRSGLFAPADQLTYIDLLNGNGYGEWNGHSLPNCECGDSNECASGYACSEGLCTIVSGSPPMEESILSRFIGKLKDFFGF